MSNMLWIKVELGAGTITTAIQEARELANRLGVGVEFDFNGVVMYVKGDSNVEVKLKEYRNSAKNSMKTGE